MWGIKGDQKNQILFEDESCNILGKDVNFQGKAKFTSTVRVDGHFEGEIISEDAVIIGEDAVIKGTITGVVIICGGKVEGTMTASQKVQLLKPAVVLGDIHSPSFSMEEGVLFQGTSDMDVTGLDGVPSQAGPAENIQNVHDLSTHRDHKVQSQEA